MNTKTIAALAALTLLAVALSGCASGDDTRSQKDEVDSLRVLLQHHVRMECTTTIDATGNGLHHDLSGPCSGRLVPGSITGTSVEWSGNTGNLGDPCNRLTQVGCNRESTVGVFTVDATGKNSATTTVKYNSEHDEVHTAKVIVKMSTEAGFGKYLTCFNFDGFKDSNAWMYGIQEKADPTKPYPKCVTFKASKEGWF